MNKQTIVTNDGHGKTNKEEEATGHIYAQSKEGKVVEMVAENRKNETQQCIPVQMAKNEACNSGCGGGPVGELAERARHLLACTTDIA